MATTLLQSEAFYHRLRVRHMRTLIERLTLLLVHATISFRVWDDGWTEAYDTLWLNSAAAVTIIEFALTSSAMHVGDNVLHVDTFQVALLQILSAWVLYTNGIMVCIASDDVHTNSDSQEFVEKLVLVSITFVTSMWRFVDVIRMEQTTITTDNSRVTGEPYYIGSDMLLAKDTTGGYRFVRTEGAGAKPRTNLISSSELSI